MSIVYGVIFFVGCSLHKTYRTPSLKEVRRQARAGDKAAKQLHRVRSFGLSLDVLLWIWIGLSAAGFFYILSRSTSGLLAVILLMALIWFGFFWIPNSRVTRLGHSLAVWLAPVLAWILNYVHPVLERLGLLVQKFQHVTVHTGVYDRDDLIKLLNQQKKQADNRLTPEELEIAKHALSFGDQLVRDALIAKRVVKSVSVEDTVGPILMGELHDSGHSRFPVYDGKKDNIIGVLMLRDLVGKKSGGKVKDIMHPEVRYLHESQTLYQALVAMLKTRHHLFVVVNSFEEIVGILTLEDVIERVIGRPIVDEFDRYDDMRAVAEQAAAKVHKEQKHEKIPETVPDGSQG